MNKKRPPTAPPVGFIEYVNLTVDLKIVLENAASRLGVFAQYGAAGHPLVMSRVIRSLRAEIGKFDYIGGELHKALPKPENPIITVLKEHGIDPSDVGIKEPPQ